MANLKKVIHGFSIIIYIFIITYALVCIPMVFGYNPLVVLSGSMEPTYKVGSILYYKKVAENDLNKGDVITFYSNKREVVSHRIVSINDGLIETKGDANNVADVNKINYSDVIGKVGKFNLQYVGYYIKSINDNLKLFMIIAVVILVSDFLISNSENLDINENKGKE